MLSTAERYPVKAIQEEVDKVEEGRATKPEVHPKPPGSGPLWRSLLFPIEGQRALVLAPAGSGLFGSLKQAGARIERSTQGAPPSGEPFDLVLEELTNGFRLPRKRRMLPLLSPGGCWVAVVEKKRCVGFTGHRILRQMRREGFKKAESFYAHPSLRAPQILVPLDHPEPFDYFLRLAVHGSAPGRRLMAVALRLLWKFRLHRILVRNLIVLARRDA